MVDSFGFDAIPMKGTKHIRAIMVVEQKEKIPEEFASESHRFQKTLYDLHDGKQRIVTIFLLLLVCLDIMKTEEPNVANQKDKKELQEYMEKVEEAIWPKGKPGNPDCTRVARLIGAEVDGQFLKKKLRFVPTSSDSTEDVTTKKSEPDQRMEAVFKHCMETLQAREVSQS